MEIPQDSRHLDSSRGLYFSDWETYYVQLVKPTATRQQGPTPSNSSKPLASSNSVTSIYAVRITLPYLSRTLLHEANTLLREANTLLERRAPSSVRQRPSSERLRLSPAKPCQKKKIALAHHLKTVAERHHATINLRSITLVDLKISLITFPYFKHRNFYHSSILEGYF